jgi:glycosyltransferase involved in cell wall biosynthesis
MGTVASSRTRLNIVSPAFNEEQNIGAWIQKIDQFFGRYQDIFSTVNLIIVDDGSKDKTHQVCQSFRAQLRFIQIVPIKLARNFGHQAALACGLIESLKYEADVVVTMDADDEHPIELVPEMVAAWKTGSKLVHTVRNENHNLPIHKRWLSRGFYWFIRVATGLSIESGMADFKLWDFLMLKECAEYIESCGALRLFAVYVSPQGKKLSFDQRVIQGRVSRFSTRKMLSLAMQSVVFYSSMPMRLIGVSAGACFFVAILLSLQSLYAYFLGLAVPGWTTIVLALSFFSGSISLSMYIIAEYLLRLSFRTRLPLFIKG